MVIKRIPPLTTELFAVLNLAIISAILVVGLIFVFQHVRILEYQKLDIEQISRLVVSENQKDRVAENLIQSYIDNNTKLNNNQLKLLNKIINEINK